MSQLNEFWMALEESNMVPVVLFGAIVFVLLACILIHNIIFTVRRNRFKKGAQQSVREEGWAQVTPVLCTAAATKPHVCRGEVYVQSVDGERPLFNANALANAFVLSPGVHHVVLSADAQKATPTQAIRYGDSYTPYFSRLGPYGIDLWVQENDEILLMIDIDTQEIIAHRPTEDEQYNEIVKTRIVYT